MAGLAIFLILAVASGLADPALQYCPSYDGPADEVSFLQTLAQIKKPSLLGLHEESGEVSDEESAKREFRRGCEELVERLEKDLGDQDLVYEKRKRPNKYSHRGDPLFSTTQASIGKADGDCGDSAHDIKEPCEKFNHWSTFQAVATSMGMEPFQVVGDGIEFHDIGQGKLGDCYFMAALATVANTHPHLLENMFVSTSETYRGQRELSENVYTTRWFVNGQVTDVQVDNMLPAGTLDEDVIYGQDGKPLPPDLEPFFAKPSDEGEWWPVILEKAWAKIFGSYSAVEGGNPAEAIQAMTQAPVFSHRHAKSDVDAIWQKLEEATKDKFPMTTSTSPPSNPKKYGLAQNHAYAVLGTTLYKNKRCVRMMNPWRKDHYEGKVPNTREVNGPDHRNGVFTMEMTEFFDAFSRVDIAMVRSGYTAFHNTKYRPGIATNRVAAFTVTVNEPGDFYAFLTWPAKRMLPEGCIVGFPKATLEASNIADPSKKFSRLDPNLLMPHNGLTTQISNPTGGASFSVHALAEIEPDAGFDRVQLSLYAPVGATIVDDYSGDLGHECTQQMKDGEIPPQAKLACRHRCEGETGSRSMKVDCSYSGRSADEGLSCNCL